MANVIIKSEERKQHEQYVMQTFGVDKNSTSAREAVECVAARSREAVAELRRMEEKQK